MNPGKRKSPTYVSTLKVSYYSGKLSTCNVWPGYYIVFRLNITGMWYIMSERREDRERHLHHKYLEIFKMWRCLCYKVRHRNCNECNDTRWISTSANPGWSFQQCGQGCSALISITRLRSCWSIHSGQLYCSTLARRKRCHCKTSSSLYRKSFLTLIIAVYDSIWMI